MLIFRPFFIALQFLTILPVRLKGAVKDEDIGRSLLYYPLVGLIIGLLLAGFTWLAFDLPTRVHSALLLLLWVVLTGALHLDGLADSADAWIGGLGDREKTLAIMKDPYCGPTAVVTLVLLLLIKFVCLEQIVIAGEWRSLMLVPVLARTAMPLLFLTTDYVRSSGLGTHMSAHQLNRMSMIVIVTTVAAVAIFAGITGCWMLLTTVLLFILIRALMVRRIGGMTGDTAGAMVEIIEAGALITVLLSFPMSLFPL